MKQNKALELLEGYEAEVYGVKNPAVIEQIQNNFELAIRKAVIDEVRERLPKKQDINNMLKQTSYEYGPEILEAIGRNSFLEVINAILSDIAGEVK